MAVVGFTRQDVVGFTVRVVLYFCSAKLHEPREDPLAVDHFWREANAIAGFLRSGLGRIHTPIERASHSFRYLDLAPIFDSPM